MAVSDAQRRASEKYRKAAPRTRGDDPIDTYLPICVWVVLKEVMHRQLGRMRHDRLRRRILLRCGYPCPAQTLSIRLAPMSVLADLPRPKPISFSTISGRLSIGISTSNACAMADSANPLRTL